MNVAKKTAEAMDDVAYRHTAGQFVEQTKPGEYDGQEMSRIIKKEQKLLTQSSKQK